VVLITLFTLLTRFSHSPAERDAVGVRSEKKISRKVISEMSAGVEEKGVKTVSSAQEGVQRAVKEVMYCIGAVVSKRETWRAVVERVNR
jgi:Cdc6-like AAA superfamily ATPase